VREEGDNAFMIRFRGIRMDEAMEFRVVSQRAAEQYQEPQRDRTPDPRGPTEIE